MSYITNDNDTEEGIKRCFKDLMHVESEVISDNLSKLVTYLNDGKCTCTYMYTNVQVCAHVYYM